MKLGLTLTFHYLVLVSFTLLLTPFKTIHSKGKVNEAIVQKSQHKKVVKEDTVDILHGGLLFRY